MATALDTETKLATVSQPVPELVSVAIAGNVGRGIWPAHAPGLREVVIAVLLDGMICHNAPYDVLVLLRRWPDLLPYVLDAYERGRIYDTMTRDKMIDIGLGQWWRKHKYDLGTVADRRCRIAVDKTDKWRKRYGELIGLEIWQWPAEAVAYAMNDVDSMLSVFWAQQHEAGRYSVDLLGTAAEQARGHLPLYCQTVVGIQTDQRQVDRVEARLTHEIDILTRACLAAGLVRAEGKRKITIKATPAKAQAAMLMHCAAMGIGPLMTDGGKSGIPQVALSEDALIHASVPGVNKALEDLIVNGVFIGHPLDAFRRRKALQTLRTKSIPALRRPVIRTRYGEVIDTGRTSSSAPQGRREVKACEWWEWTGTNLQNQPTAGGFRECLVPPGPIASADNLAYPPPSHLFVTSDWSGAELVCLGQVQLDWFGSSALADAMRDPKRDPHRELAARLFRVAESLVTKEQRKAAKPANFGFPGGLGVRRFVDYAARAPYYLTLTEDEARYHRSTWREQWPEMQLYHDVIDSMTGPDGRITMVHPRSGFVRGGMRYTEACNSPFQSLQAFVAKLALWYLWRACLDPASPLFGCRQVLFVHDENVTVVEAGPGYPCPGPHTKSTCDRCKHTGGMVYPRAEAVRDEQERLMKLAALRYCPDVPMGVESTITRRYCK